jgi:hypothetical protein
MYARKCPHRKAHAGDQPYILNFFASAGLQQVKKHGVSALFRPKV